MNRYWHATIEDKASLPPVVNGLTGIYNEHFGLSVMPFSLTPDTQFFFANSSATAALNILIVATRSGEGFTKVVGEVGTGKTLLCRLFLDKLSKDRFVTAYVPNPYLEPMTLLLAIADELGVRYPENCNQHQLLRALSHFLVDTFAQEQRTVVVCLDEAHAMPTESLEALRLLSNLETEKRKLLQIVLFGQPELDVRLGHPSVRQLRQRISFSARMRPMTKEQVSRYVQYRLQVAGHEGTRLFTRPALSLVYRGSAGTPRLVNILAHKALASAYGEGDDRVYAHHVRLAIMDTESAVEQYCAQRRRRVAMAGAAAGSAVGAAMLLGGLL